ncbi:MAG TPA: TPM domain-containing protein [Chitinophagaceae bacterium]|nr:TPM domain-containing protein [Chitinophagaceae bacterium]
MSLFSLFRKKDFFSEEEKQQIIEAVRNAERMTSGEVRVFVENRCSYMDAIDRAKEIFAELKMYETHDRNAVLVYVALKDKQLAIFGDEGIHRKLGYEYWNGEVKKMIDNFNKENYAEGIKQVVEDIGEALTQLFPYNNDTDKNELPDHIVFGK